jgi:hypothetical protein
VSVFQIYTNTTGVKTAYLTGGTGSTVGINTVTGASAVVNSLSIQEVFNTSTTAAPVLGSTFQLGGFNGTQQIIGTIKDVSIYNRALPAGQTI